MDNELLTDTIEAMTWLVRDAEGRADEWKGNLDVGSQGGYSEELVKARATWVKLIALKGKGKG